jgi:hypothetical protein
MKMSPKRGLPKQRRLARQPRDIVSNRFSHQAQHFWNGIPEQHRERLLANVWCGKCLGGTAIVNFRGTVEEGNLILRGFCSRCGSEVARLIEGT